MLLRLLLVGLHVQVAFRGLHRGMPQVAPRHQQRHSRVELVRRSQCVVAARSSRAWSGSAQAWAADANSAVAIWCAALLVSDGTFPYKSIRSGSGQALRLVEKRYARSESSGAVYQWT